MNEGLHDNASKITNVFTKGSDQPGHLSSLIRDSIVYMNEECLGPLLPIVQTTKSDQTRQRPKLIRIFAGLLGNSAKFCFAAAQMLLFYKQKAHLYSKSQNYFLWLC